MLRTAGSPADPDPARSPTGDTGIDAGRIGPPHPRPIVAICVARSVDAARLVVAVEAGDRIVTVVDSEWPTSLQLRRIAAARATLVITDLVPLADALRAGDASCDVVTVSALDGIAADADPLPPRSAASVTPAPDPDAPFLLLWSSGTTGEPKAFLKTRTQYSADLEISRQHLGAAPRTATFAPGPLSYSLALYALFESLAAGGAVHLSDRLDDLWLTPRLREERVTRVVTVPAALHALAEAATRHPERSELLDTIVSCGAALSAATRHRIEGAAPRALVISCLGASELGLIGDSRGADGIIRLYPQVRARVRDDIGADLPAGELGTLWVRSPSCARGYVPATTDETLTDADGWATVHDQGRLHGRRLTFTGRLGDVVTTGGYTVSLDTVEHAFDGIEGLGAVCAIAEPHDGLGSVITLVVEGDAPDWIRLRSWARGRLPSASVPRRWISLPVLPRTTGGKVRRVAVAALVAEGRRR